jgi:hypothetical protein
MRFARWLYTIAGIYGLIVLAPQYFMEEMIGRDYPPPITHPEFFYGFIGTALAWQVLFLFLGRDPARYRPMMIPSVLEKMSFAIAVLVLYAKNRTSTATLAFGLVDLTLGVLFIAAYIKTGDRLPKQASYE